MAQPSPPRLIHLALPALVLLAACGDVAPEVASLMQPITDGKEDTAHASVGYLAAGDSVGCTGTLVGRQTVLTAAHCISGSAQTFVLDGASYLSSLSVVHSKYDASTRDNDIGLLRLQRGVHRVPSRLSPVPGAVGTPVILVGYGATSEGGTDSGTKRVANNSIKSLHPSSFNVEGTGGGTGNVCHNDSGGPVFTAAPGGEAQLGVVIGGLPPCGTTGIAMRVDFYLAWLRGVAKGDLAVFGEANAGFGMPCAAGKDCASGICQEDQASGDKYCSLTCAGPGATCPEGGICMAPASGGQTTCQLPLPPEAEETGCSLGVAGGRTTPTSCLLLLGLLAVLFRRK